MGEGVPLTIIEEKQTSQRLLMDSNVTLNCQSFPLNVSIWVSQFANNCHQCHKVVSSLNHQTHVFVCDLFLYLLRQAATTLTAGDSLRVVRSVRSVASPNPGLQLSLGRHQIYLNQSKCWQNLLCKKFKPSSPQILGTFILRKKSLVHNHRSISNKNGHMLPTEQRNALPISAESH